MENEEFLSSDLITILDEFERIRDAYAALKNYCAVQDETLTIEKEYSEKMTENLDKISKAHMVLERKYKSTIDQLKAQRNSLQKTIDDLKEQCDHLRLLNAEKCENDEQIFRLQDEVEVLKTQLSIEEEKHNEEIALLKQQHSDEIQRYKMLLQSAKQASTGGETRKRGRPKNSNKNTHPKYFRWPELSVKKLTNTEENEAANTGTKKRRKLYFENGDNPVDIV